MVYKRFSILLIVRVIILLINLIFISIVITKPEKFFTSILLSLLLILILFDLIRFINKTNWELSRFINAVKQNDFTINFTDNHLGQSFHDLNQSFTNILTILNKSQLEKETKVQYLKLVVNSLNVGILIYNKSGKIELLNKASLDLLSIQHIANKKELFKVNKKFAVETNDLKPGVTKLIETTVKQEKLQLSVNLNKLKILGEDLYLLTFQDIKNEIEQKELEAWQNLFRTLAHEIMNSVTPISSLTETGIELLENKNGKLKTINELNDNCITKIQTALKTVNVRSNHLHDFVTGYRKLLKIPTPDLKRVLVSDFLRSIQNLVNPELKIKKINLKIKLETQDLTINADSGLLEQVILNLIQNSIDALQNTNPPGLTIEAFRKNEKTCIKIKDNGIGIKPDRIDKIFIPFYTTKKKGSGIGLSLSKQIMKMHNGTISVSSVPNKSTKFTLIFNNQF